MNRLNSGDSSILKFLTSNLLNQFHWVQFFFELKNDPEFILGLIEQHLSTINSLKNGRTRLALCGITTVAYHRYNHFNRSLLPSSFESMSMGLFWQARLKFFRVIMILLQTTRILRKRWTGSNAMTINSILCLPRLIKHTKPAEKVFQRSKLIIHRY